MKKPEHITLIESEIADFKQRAGAAQSIADNAQREINAHQTVFQNASREVVAYSAAAQAFEIALAKLTPPKPKPAKKGPSHATPPVPAPKP